MKKLLEMKKLLTIIGIIIIFLIAAVIFKNQLIKTAITKGATNVVGAPVKIKKFSLGIFNQTIRIKDFKIINPEGFPEGAVVDMPEISVDYDLSALLKKNLHFKKLVIDLKLIGIYRNKDGELNLDSLKIVERGQKSTKGAEEKEEPSEPMPMQIDVLTLKIGKVVYKDLSAGEKPTVEVFDIGISKTYKNITSAQQLVALIFAEPMKKVAIKGAKAYGVTTVLGTVVGATVLPVGVTAVLIGKDSYQADFALAYDKIYNTSIKVVKQMGKLTKEDSSKGIIKGKVSGSNITVKLERKTKKSIQVTVSARKLLIPKPTVAGGVLHEITEKLK
jgi:uncharacterized protein involved in outer membrane biogenesis